MSDAAAVGAAAGATAFGSASRRDRIEYAAFRAALAILRVVPLRFGVKLGAAVGLVFYLFDAHHRRIALTNLGLALPGRDRAEHRRILRATCRNLGRIAFEMAHLAELNRENLGRYVRIDDPESWDRAIARMRETGAVILTGHFGNWELLAYACGLLGHRITLVHRPMRNPLVGRDIGRLRERAGTMLIPKRNAAKEVLCSLRQRALVAIPFDQNQTRSFGVFVDFFGVPASTTTGPVRLAMRTGVPIVPVFLVREGTSERHRIVMLPEVELTTTGDRDTDIRVNTQRCNAVFEQMVRRHPDHWIWFHKRWRTRPSGEPRIY